MDQILRHIKDGQHLLIASHAEPDGDAVGCLIALGLALREFGKKATLGQGRGSRRYDQQNTDDH
jgi:phosphoesterase RecJ-like protein